MEEEGVRRSERLSQREAAASAVEGAPFRPPTKSMASAPSKRGEKAGGEQSWATQSPGESLDCFSSRVVAMLKEYERSKRALAKLKDEQRRVREVHAAKTNRAMSGARLAQLKEEISELEAIQATLVGDAGPFLEKFANEKRFSAMEGLSRSESPGGAGPTPCVPPSGLPGEEKSGRSPADGQPKSGRSLACPEAGGDVTGSGRSRTVSTPASGRSLTASSSAGGTGATPRSVPLGPEQDVESSDEESVAASGGGLLQAIKQLESPVDLMSFSFGDEDPGPDGKKKKKKVEEESSTGGEMEGSGRPSLGQILLLVSSSAVTAIFYSVYRQKHRRVQTLKGAQKISLDDDLPRVLMDLPGKCVPYAVIEGVVRSVKDSLHSQFVENCRGVIHRLSLKEHKMVWNRTTHLWSDQEKVIHQRTNSVPFDLTRDEDPGPSVRVVKPLEAAELDLETVYEKFHPAVQSFTNVLGHFITGERPKGIQETEEMLRVGATVTGVGELVLDHKLLKLQPPKAGRPFYLSSLDFQALVQRQEAQVRLWRLLAVVCGVATCVTLFFILRGHYRRHKERQRLQQLQREFQEASARLEDEEEDARNACTICLSRQKSCVFLECGHVCSCYQCYQALPQPKTCPICRTGIARMVPLYNS